MNSARSYKAGGKARLAGNVGTFPKGATQSTGLVRRALREIDTRFPGVVGRLDKVTCIACDVRLASERVSVSEPVRIDQRSPGHMPPEKRILREICGLAGC